MAYYAGSIYGTEQRALVASVYDYVTGSGGIAISEALHYAASGRQESIDEARTYGWAYGAEEVDGEYEWNRDAESWGVHQGISDQGEPCDFEDAEINDAFDAVVARIREEIGEDTQS